MQDIFRNWNFFRALRLVAGISILVYGYMEVDWLLMLIGTTFGVMALANTACGPFANNCKVDYKEKTENEPN
jgi:hypothetical protein